MFNISLSCLDATRTIRPGNISSDGAAFEIKSSLIAKQRAIEDNMAEAKLSGDELRM